METNSHETVVEAKNLYKVLGNKMVLKNVSVSVKKGEIFTIIGPSGCGKTTFLRHIVGLLLPDDGYLNVLGKRIDSTTQEEDLNLIRKKIGVVFQGGALFDSMTVEENLFFPLEYCVKDKLSLAEKKERVSEMLSHVGLYGIESMYPFELSGGMRKRVSIARALMHSPQLILYDEPTTGLDPITSAAIDELILSLSKKFEVTSLVVTHDLNSVKKIADGIVLLYNGEVVWQGSKSEMLTTENPYVVQFLKGTTKGPMKLFEEAV